MKFVQLIEYTSSRPDEIQKALEEWLAATQGKRANTSGLRGRDRDRPNTFIEIVTFPSYEVAMKNSELPETKEFSALMQKLCDGPATFRNLDVIYEET